MCKILKCFSLLCLLFSFSFLGVKSEIKNFIVVKVAGLAITSVDVENEILTNLIMNKQEITQTNIDKNKPFAIKNLINKTIKKKEVNKFEIINFSKIDLKLYIERIAKTFNTDTKGLKKIFKANSIDYDTFVKNHKIELLWNSLIYTIYKNQININIVEVEQEVQNYEQTGTDESIQFNLSEIEILKTEYSNDKFIEILDTIKNESFEVAAMKYSMSSNGQDGGLIGWVKGKSLTNIYLKEIKKLSIKELSTPIFNEKTVTIFKLNNIKKNEEKNTTIELKEKIITQKKQDKLNLYSRSHFSNLENIISIKFQ